MLEKSAAIVLCRCRRRCTLLHKAKSLALGFVFQEATVHSVLISPLTIENSPEEFCSKLFKINTQRHAAVGRRERTSPAPWREEVSAGGAGTPPVRTAGPWEHSIQGWLLPASCSLNQCNVSCPTSKAGFVVHC